MVEVAARVRVIEGVSPDTLPLSELVAGGQPVVIRGLISGWGLVRAGLGSDHRAMEYVSSFYNGKPIQFSFGDESVRGRPFYSADFSKLNFSVRRDRLDNVLREIEDHLQDERPPTYYVASLLVDSCLPGFRAENDLGFSAHGIDPPPSIWIGNRTIAACHYDAPNNIACCAVGKRRFTVFPPDQIFNLYPGPLEPTPGGQAVSVVDFQSPDYDAYPGFRDALKVAQQADLEPGDAIFIPSMWWHHVEGLSRFNTLVNYWWGSMPSFIPTPMHALLHALWAIRDRPEREKDAWRQVFEYYVFADAERAGAHLPEAARGLLATLDEGASRQLRSMLINKLNR